jgi:hypothetical protein
VVKALVYEAEMGDDLGAQPINGERRSTELAPGSLPRYFTGLVAPASRRGHATAWHRCDGRSAGSVLVNGDVPARLGVAYEAFEFLVAALETGPRLAATIMAAGHAGDGRDELALAPSLLPIYEAFPSLYASAGVQPVGTGELAALCRDLAAHLDRTATLASNSSDWRACLAASACTRRIEAVMSGRPRT